MKKQSCKLSEAKVMLLCTTDNMIWQFLLPHIKDLVSYGAKVDCICSKTGFWFDELKEKYGLNMIDLPMKRSPINMTNIKAYRRLKKLQKQEKYNLIYCQQPTGGLLGRLIGKKFNLPVIYTAHGFFFFKGNHPLKNIIFKSAERYLARFTDVLITMNEEDYRVSLGWKSPYKDKINGIGINPDKYEQSDNFNKVAFKQELGIKPDEQIILSVSEFIKRKNYPTMLRSFAMLTQTHDKVKYVLCGTGKLLLEMQNYAKELKIDDKVIFLGYRKDINKIMQIADVFFHESFQEGLTMSIMEAMHFGLPVVTSNVRGNVDLIDDGKGGYVTGCHDVAAQKEALTSLLNDENLRVNMGKYNKERVKDFYLDTVKAQLYEIYKKANLLN